MERLKSAEAQKEWGVHGSKDKCPWQKPNPVPAYRDVLDDYYRKHLREFARGSTPPLTVLDIGERFDLENYPFGTIFWNTGRTFDGSKVRHWSEYAVLAKVVDGSDMNGALQSTLVSFDAVSILGSEVYRLRSTYFNPGVIGMGEHTKLITGPFTRWQRIRTCTRMEILKYGEHKSS